MGGCLHDWIVAVAVVEVVVVLVVLIPLKLSYEELNTREKRQRLDGSPDRTAELQLVTRGWWERGTVARL